MINFLKQFTFNTQKIVFSKFDDSTPKNCHKNWELFEMFESTVVQTILVSMISMKKTQITTFYSGEWLCILLVISIKSDKHTYKLILKSVFGVNSIDD